MYNYAQLDKNNRVVGLSQLTAEVDAPHMILLTEEQWKIQPLGWVFDPESGKFRDDAPSYPGDDADSSAVIVSLLAGALSLTGGDTGGTRWVASMASAAMGFVDARRFETGMETMPGDLVYGPDGVHIYIFTGAEPMTHSNPTFFPGASGVFYWSIVPKMHEGYRAYPDVVGIIVAVRRGEIWWNAERTARFRWESEDNNAVVWPPGAVGVHQWAAL